LDNLIAPHGSHLVDLLVEQERAAELAESLADGDRPALRAADVVIDTSTFPPAEATHEGPLFLVCQGYLLAPEKG